MWNLWTHEIKGSRIWKQEVDNLLQIGTGFGIKKKKQCKVEFL